MVVMSTGKTINVDYIMADYPEFSEITEDVVNKNIRRRFTGGVRIQKGMYRTKKQTDEYIKKSLERNLP